MTFAETLIDARAQLGYSQAELASAIGVSPRTIFRWEKDEEPTDIKKRGTLAVLAGILTPVQRRKSRAKVSE